jgi:hypothetical protein
MGGRRRIASGGYQADMPSGVENSVTEVAYFLTSALFIYKTLRHHFILLMSFGQKGRLGI